MTKITKKIITFMLMALMLLAMPLTAFAVLHNHHTFFHTNLEIHHQLELFQYSYMFGTELNLSLIHICNIAYTCC